MLEKSNEEDYNPLKKTKRFWAVAGWDVYKKLPVYSCGGFDTTYDIIKAKLYDSEGKARNAIRMGTSGMRMYRYVSIVHIDITMTPSFSSKKGLENAYNKDDSIGDDE